MRRTKRDALILKLLIAAVALLGLNTLLLLAVLLRPAPQAPVTDQPVASLVAQPAASTATQPSSSTLPTTPSTSPSTPGAPAMGASSLETVLKATVEPLQKAASDFGLELAQVLPSEVEQQACLDSDSIDSEACAAVVVKLQAGYASVNMPFPNLIENLSKAAPTLPTEPGATEPGATEPGATAPDATAPTEAASVPATVDPGQRDILRAYFSVITERLSREADKLGKSAEITLPSADVIEAAAATGTHESEASKALLDSLRGQYQGLGLEFPEPPA
jgi:hypothetical protein